METARQVNRSPKTIFALTAAFGILMFALNFMTPMLVDDYTYCYSFADGKRISYLLQIIPSMENHYQTMNGKVIVHGALQLLLMLPQGVFDVLNALMACLLCLVIYSYIWRMRHDFDNAVMFFYVIAALWLFVRSFGHVFLWMAGSVNYLWSTTILLLYMKPIYTDYSGKHTKAFWIWYILAGFIMGTLTESTSFAVLGFFVIRAAYKILIDKEKVEPYKLMPILSMSCGYLVILFSPAGKERISVRRGLLEGIAASLRMYVSSYPIPLAIGIVTAAVLLLFGLEKEKLMRALVWAFLSCGMNCMLSIAAYHPGRSEAGAAVFLIIADGYLLSLLFDHAEVRGQGSWGRKVTWICRLFTGYICLFLLYQMVFILPAGIEAVHTSWIQISEEEQHIRDMVEKGEEDVIVPVVTASSPYAAVYELHYVDTTRYDTWPNESMAKYYGAARIIGTE